MDPRLELARRAVPIVKWVLIGWLVLVLILLGAFKQQDIPAAPPICGTPANGHWAGKGVKIGRTSGEWMHRVIETTKAGTADVTGNGKRMAEGMERIFRSWVLAFLFGANGESAKIDPQILRLEEEYDQAQEDANRACTPCVPAVNPDEVAPPPGSDEDPPSVASVSGSGPTLAARAAARYFPASEVRTAVAVAGAESGYRANVRSRPNTNGTYDHGLWQINSVHSTLLNGRDWRDPGVNAWMAYQVWKDSGWTAWTTYNTGAYRQYLPQGRAAAAALGQSDRPVVPQAPAPAPGGPVAPVEPLTPGEPAPLDEAPDAQITCEDTAAPGADAEGSLVDTRVVWPTPSRQVGNGYGGHTGIDLNGPGNATGAPVKVAASGRVDYVGTGRGYGLAVFVETTTGYINIYGHLSRADVRAGQQVSAGDPLGAIGYSGNVRPPGPRGAHLHFEARKASSPNTMGTQAGSLAFLRGEAPNLRPGTVTAVPVSRSGVRRVKDPSSGVVYSIPIPAGPAGDAVNFALDQLGDPYRWASPGPDSWDCSSLTARAWNQAGARPKVTPQTEAMVAQLRRVSQARPGDLLYQPGHVQMYLGKIGGQQLIVEAPRSGLRVRIVRQWMTPTAVLRPDAGGVRA